MKYVISWRERPAASSRGYEAARERILEIFSEKWKMPESFNLPAQGKSRVILGLR